MAMRILLIAMGVALIGFAPAPFPKTERQREDLTDVTGTWEFVRWEYNGSRVENNEVAYFIEMTREKCCVVAKDNSDKREDFVMRLAPGASPPAFTWSVNNKVMFVGSYRLQKDQMTMILTSGSNLEKRPTDFAGMPQYRFIIKRVKRG
jgi:uncharacterized protein (TIGR03067 family)